VQPRIVEEREQLPDVADRERVQPQPIRLECF
jgi:hypothetical protein